MKTNLQRKSGAALVVAVLSMVVAGLVGTAILSKATSSRYERVQYGITNRAYYLAESGAAYVRSRRSMDPLFGLAPFTPLTNTFPNGDRFVVDVYLTNVVAGMVTGQHVMVESIGIAHPGTVFEAQQRIYFDMHERGISTNSLDVSLYDDEGNFNWDLWDLVNLSESDIKVGHTATGHSGDELAITIKGTEAALSLDWQDQPDLNLLKVWSYHGGLLSYDAQMKVWPYDNPGIGFGRQYMIGISFRLQTNGGSYGVSFFRSIPEMQERFYPSWAQATRMDANFIALRGTNDHVVLWYRAASNAMFQLLASHRLLTNENVVQDFGETVDPRFGLSPYATLLLQLDEEWTGTNRQNRISAYVQGRDNCPSCYPSWPSNDPTNAVWQENAAVFPSPVVFSNQVSGTWVETTNVVSSLLTSAGFDSGLSSEIAIHIFYDQAGAEAKYFDDFALRVPGFGSTAGGTQIQW